MKKALFIAWLLCIATLASANKIDNLKTIRDVKKFIKNNIRDKEWLNDIFIDRKPVDTSAYGKNKFFKIDLDNNGRTDLVVNGRYILIIMDKGRNEYTANVIDRPHCEEYLQNITYPNKAPLIIVKGIQTVYEDYKPVDTISRLDTFVAKFDDIYEYNEHPDSLGVSEIRLINYECHGTCPIFKLIITADRKITYEATKYNEIEGEFEAVLDTVSFNKLIGILNYIKLNSLQDKYPNALDIRDPFYLVIKFNNGQTKEITSDLPTETFGLGNFYDQLFKLRTTLEWESKL